MDTINYSELLQDMLTAAKTELHMHWKEVKPYAKKEFESFAANIKMIAELKAEGAIDEEKARLQMTIQKNSMAIVLLTIEGLGLLAVEQAINAALDVVRTTVNSAIGWTIL